jgi:hypothetical protein
LAWNLQHLHHCVIVIIPVMMLKTRKNTDLYSEEGQKIPDLGNEEFIL